MSNDDIQYIALDTNPNDIKQSDPVIPIPQNKFKLTCTTFDSSIYRCHKQSFKTILNERLNIETNFFGSLRISKDKPHVRICKYIYKRLNHQIEIYVMVLYYLKNGTYELRMKGFVGVFDDIMGMKNNYLLKDHVTVQVFDKFVSEMDIDEVNHMFDHGWINIVCQFTDGGKCDGKLHIILDRDISVAGDDDRLHFESIKRGVTKESESVIDELLQYSGNTVQLTKNTNIRRLSRSDDNDDPYMYPRRPDKCCVML